MFAGTILMEMVAFFGLLIFGILWLSLFCWTLFIKSIPPLEEQFNEKYNKSY